MKPVILRFRLAAFAAAVASALAFGTAQAFARPAVFECTNPAADGSCISHNQCNYYCEGIGSPGGACYQGCCFCA